MVTSDSRDEKARLAQEKGLQQYERLGPLYRDLKPDFLSDLKGWIEYDPDGAYRIVARISKAADFNIARVRIQQGGATAGKAKAELHRHYEQVLVDLARPFAAKLNCGQLSYRDVAHILAKSVIPKALGEANKEMSPSVEALEHLSRSSKNRLYRIILKHKESVSASP